VQEHKKTWLVCAVHPVSLNGQWAVKEKTLDTQNELTSVFVLEKELFTFRIEPWQMDL
jgi:hypothetical protein